MRCNTIKLTFNPEEAIPEIYENKFAWPLWLLWKKGHITNQHFKDDVLTIANEIEQKKPDNLEELSRVMRDAILGYDLTNFVSQDIEKFLPEAAPYILGEKEITFEIV